MKVSSHKKRITLVGFIAFILLFVLISGNTVLSYFLENRLRNVSIKVAQQDYTLSVKTVHSNLLLGNIHFVDCTLLPDSSKFSPDEDKVHPPAPSFHFNLDELKLNGLSILKGIRKKDIRLDKLVLKRAKLTIYKNSLSQKVPRNKKSIQLDSININGLTHLNLKKLVVIHPQLVVINALTSDTISSAAAAKTIIGEICLIPHDSIDNTFSLNQSKLQSAVHDLRINLPDNNYILSNKLSKIFPGEARIESSQLAIKPRDKNLKRFAKKLHYTTGILDVDIEKLLLEEFDIFRAIRTQTAWLRTVDISGLRLSIFMDKNYPFNETKRPALPNQVLKNMGFPLHICEANINNSQLIYEELYPNSPTPMRLTLDNLQAKIRRITTIKDSLHIRKHMRLQLQSRLMNTAQLNADFAFPLYLKADTFFYTGTLGKANLPIFNPVTFPTLGARFTEGQLQSIRFTGRANNTINSGEMTMLYNNLKAEFAQKDVGEKKNLMSWAANTALIKSNPRKNGKVRVAQMYSERTPYKGFGNFLWKTLQDGIMNTLLPIGDKEKIAKDKTAKKRRKKHS